MSTKVNKKASEWTNEEIIGWAQGEVKTGNGVSDNQVANEAIKRFDYPEGRSVSQVKARILEEVKNREEEEAASDDDSEQASETQAEGQTDGPDEAKVTDDGEPEAQAKEAAAQDAPGTDDEPSDNEDETVVISEQNDTRVGASQTEEVPEEATKQSPEYNPTEAPEVVEGVPHTSAQRRSAEAIRNPKIAQPAVVEKDAGRGYFDASLEDYITNMDPKRPISASEGAAWQVRLWRLIQGVMKKEGSDFHAYYGDMLKKINEHRDGVFHERSVFRFFDTIALPAQERTNFQNMLHLMITTADPAKRNHSIKQVDLAKVTQGFRDEQTRQKLESFYSSL